MEMLWENPSNLDLDLQGIPQWRFDGIKTFPEIVLGPPNKLLSLTINIFLVMFPAITLGAHIFQA